MSETYPGRSDGGEVGRYVDECDACMLFADNYWCYVGASHDDLAELLHQWREHERRVHADG